MWSHEIDIQQEISLTDSLVAKIETSLRIVLDREGFSSPTSLTLLLTDNERIRELNRRYRAIDSATDVLSFPAGDEMPGMEEFPPYLGDIAISVPYAAKQAETTGHDLSAELQLLAIHGLLHLLGYDHAEPKEKERMWQAQAAALAQLGLSPDMVVGENDA